MNHPEKKEAIMTFAGPQSLKRKINNVANLRDVTASKLMRTIVEEYIQNLADENRLMAEALLHNENDI